MILIGAFIPWLAIDILFFDEFFLMPLYVLEGICFITQKQNDTNEVFINCMLAFIDFELSYCSHTDYKYTEDLDKAKDTLRRHLARNRG